MSTTEERRKERIYGLAEKGQKIAAVMKERGEL